MAKAITTSKEKPKTITLIRYNGIWQNNYTFKKEVKLKDVRALKKLHKR